MHQEIASVFMFIRVLEMQALKVKMRWSLKQ